jgi:hypothetical protein
MKKLKLMLDEIQVTGFVVTPAESGSGTVNGQELITRQTYCDGDETCWYTCAPTCDPSLC